MNYFDRSIRKETLATFSIQWVRLAYDGMVPIYQGYACSDVSKYIRTSIASFQRILSLTVW